MDHLTDILVAGVVHLALVDLTPPSELCLYLQHPGYVYSVMHRNELPICEDSNSRVVIVSDTHDRHHRVGKLPPCDVLIHCGDVLMVSKHFSMRAAIKKFAHFNAWLGTCDAKQRIVLGGNHDDLFEKIGKHRVQELLTNGQYVENDICNIGQLSAWGTPLSTGRSPNRAFQSKEFLQRTLAEKPSEVDILITHGQCDELTSTVKHKLHIWGHNHNSYGIRYAGDFLKVHHQPKVLQSMSICVPIMDGNFRMRNMPVVIDLPKSGEGLDEIPHSRDISTHHHTYKGSTKHSSVKTSEAIVSSSVKPEGNTTTFTPFAFFSPWRRYKIVPTATSPTEKNEQ